MGRSVRVKSTFCALAFLGLLPITCDQAVAARVVIDDFESPHVGKVFYIMAIPANDNPNALVSDPNPTLIRTLDSGIAGGERDLVVEVLGSAETGSALGIVGHNLATGANELQVATAPGPPSIVTLQYDGPDPNGDGFANAHNMLLNLSDGGSNHVLAIYINGTDRSMNLDATITSPGGLSSTYHGTVAYSDGYLKLLPFSSFVGNASFDAVDSLTLVFNASRALGAPSVRNLDFRITSISAVPEPSSLALLGMGVCVLTYHAARWRCRRT